MRYLPNSKQMKEADRYTIESLKVPSLTLMERAAQSCVNLIVEHGIDDKGVCVVCGSGNNGGDGFAIARMLLNMGYDVTIVMAGNPEKCTDETRYQMERLKEAGGEICTQFPKTEYSVIVDAIFGVGLSRFVSGGYRTMIEEINDSKGWKVAVDIPSGVSADNGEVLGVAFRADMTVTFQAEKIGLSLYPGKEYAGKVHVTDIGISHDTFEQDLKVAVSLNENDYKQLLPVRKADSHKGTYGKLLVIAGSKGMSGAAFLNAMAAYRAGAGLVQIYTAEENRMILQTLLPEAIIATYEMYNNEPELRRLIGWADAICIGSGIGTSIFSAEEMVKMVMEESKVPCVVDADALNILATHPKYLQKKTHNRFIFTPHMKEMCRITDIPDMNILKRNRLELLSGYSKNNDITCVLKDAKTIIQSPDSRAYVNPSGNSAMAKAGSGDVLAGIIGGLLAQGLSCEDAAILGTYIHGKAGDYARDRIGVYSVLARDLMDKIGSVMKDISGS